MADDGRGGRHVVFEFRSGSQSQLLAIRRPPPPPMRNVIGPDGQVRQVAGRLDPAVESACASAIEQIVLDECLLLGPKAPTAYPEATCGEIELRDGPFGTWKYRVVRPQAHFEDERAWMGQSFRGWLKFPAASFETPLAQSGEYADRSSTPAALETLETPEAQYERPRG